MNRGYERVGLGSQARTKELKEAIGAPVCRMWMWGRTHMYVRERPGFGTWHFEFGRPKGPIEAPGRPIDRSPSLPVCVYAVLVRAGAASRAWAPRVLWELLYVPYDLVRAPSQQQQQHRLRNRLRPRKAATTPCSSRSIRFDRSIDQPNSIKAKSAALPPRFDSGGMSGTFSSGQGPGPSRPAGPKRLQQARVDTGGGGAP